jgi:hypothetical protein
MAGYCTKRSTVGQHGSGLVDPSQEEIPQIALGPGGRRESRLKNPLREICMVGVREWGDPR